MKKTYPELSESQQKAAVEIYKNASVPDDWTEVITNLWELKLNYGNEGSIEFEKLEKVDGTTFVGFNIDKWSISIDNDLVEDHAYFEGEVQFDDMLKLLELDMHREFPDYNKLFGNFYVKLAGSDDGKNVSYTITNNVYYGDAPVPKETLDIVNGKVSVWYESVCDGVLTDLQTRYYQLTDPKAVETYLIENNELIEEDDLNQMNVYQSSKPVKSKAAETKRPAIRVNLINHVDLVFDFLDSGLRNKNMQFADFRRDVVIPKSIDVSFKIFFNGFEKGSVEFDMLKVMEGVNSYLHGGMHTDISLAFYPYYTEKTGMFTDPSILNHRIFCAIFVQSFNRAAGVVKRHAGVKEHTKALTDTLISTGLGALPGIGPIALHFWKRHKDTRDNAIDVLSSKQYADVPKKVPTGIPTKEEGVTKKAPTNIPTNKSVAPKPAAPLGKDPVAETPPSVAPTTPVAPPEGAVPPTSTTPTPVPEDPVKGDTEAKVVPEGETLADGETRNAPAVPESSETENYAGEVDSNGVPAGSVPFLDEANMEKGGAYVEQVSAAVTQHFAEGELKLGLTITKDNFHKQALVYSVSIHPTTDESLSLGTAKIAFSSSFFQDPSSNGGVNELTKEQGQGCFSPSISETNSIKTILFAKLNELRNSIPKTEEIQFESYPESDVTNGTETERTEEAVEPAATGTVPETPVAPADTESSASDATYNPAGGVNSDASINRMFGWGVKK